MYVLKIYLNDNFLILFNFYNVMIFDCVIFFFYKIDFCILYKVKEIYFEVY